MREPEGEKKNRNPQPALSHFLPCTFLCKYLSPSVDREEFQRYQSNLKDLSSTSGFFTDMGLLRSATTTKALI